MLWSKTNVRNICNFCCNSSQSPDNANKYSKPEFEDSKQIAKKLENVCRKYCRKLSTVYKQTIMRCFLYFPFSIESCKDSSISEEQMLGLFDYVLDIKIVTVSRAGTNVSHFNEMVSSFLSLSNGNFLLSANSKWL